jgi:hypothetical protein
LQWKYQHHIEILVLLVCNAYNEKHRPARIRFTNGSHYLERRSTQAFKKRLRVVQVDVNVMDITPLTS